MSSQISSRSIKTSQTSETSPVSPILLSPSFSQLQLSPRRIVRNPFEKTIKSYGVIAYAAAERKWLIVHRKHSPSYTTILRANYRDSNLPDLLLGVTQEEIKKLRMIANTDEDKIEDLISNIHMLTFDSIPDRSLLDFICKRLTSSSFKQLIDQSGDHPEGPEWMWPKGRLRSNESVWECAIREFRQETGVIINDNSVISFPFPVTEVSRGTNGSLYESRCWFVIFKTLQLSTTNDPYEISETLWESEDTVRSLLPPNKANLIDKCNKMLRQLKRIAIRSSD